MNRDPVVSLLGRRLRLGLIGGGPGSFIGDIHQSAARLDGCYDLVTGVLSSNADRARRIGRDMGFSSDRVHGDVDEMLTAESAREDGIDVVSIMTPNDLHCEYALAALDRGFDVICDKPMTRTLDEAERLHARVVETGRIFCLTHVYTGYPAVRQAREMVQDGRLGTIRLIQVEYVQGGRADETPPAAGEPLPWRFDPSQAGPSLVLGDIGSHAHHLVRYVTGLEVEEVAAEAGSAVPNRPFQDFAGALLRFDNGARGAFWVTQAAAGVENCLRLRVSGSRGTLEWEQETPTHLTFKPIDGVRELRTEHGPDSAPLPEYRRRIVSGHPGGFLEAFATLYRDAAEAIAAARSGAQADPLALQFPTSRDGLEGMRYIDAVLASSESNGRWVRCAARD